MKVYALCASPRKRRNSDQMLDAFTEGLRLAVPGAEVEKVYLYDLDFKGCRSCLGCKLARNETVGCVVRDGIADLLGSIRRSDGFVYAAPVYFYDIPGQLHAFLERLIYPGSVEGGLPVAAIYTMNDTREDYERWTKPILDTLHLYFKWSCGALPAEEVYAFDTMQREVSNRYKPTSTDHVHKVARHAEVWDSELARSREAGMRYGELLRERRT